VWAEPRSVLEKKTTEGLLFWKPGSFKPLFRRASGRRNAQSDTSSSLLVTVYQFQPKMVWHKMLHSGANQFRGLTYTMKQSRVFETLTSRAAHEVRSVHIFWIYSFQLFIYLCLQVAAFTFPTTALWTGFIGEPKSGSEGLVKIGIWVRGWCGRDPGNHRSGINHHPVNDPQKNPNYSCTSIPKQFKNRNRLTLLPAFLLKIIYIFFFALMKPTN
jgi:hypothetical protein